MSDISIPIPSLAQDIKQLSLPHMLSLSCSLEIGQKIMRNISTKTRIATNAAVNIIIMNRSFINSMAFDFNSYYDETIKSSVLRGLYGN